MNRAREDNIPVNAVTIVRTGQRGRPRKEISEPLLRSLLSSTSKSTIQEVADGLGVHRNTVLNYMRKY